MSRRVVRLLVLLGVVVAAYLVLSLFDHAARADVGSIDQSAEHIGAIDPADSGMANGVGKALPEPKSIIAKAHPRTAHRPAIKTSEVHPRNVQAPEKTNASKVQAPSIRVGGTVRRVQVGTSKLYQPTFDAVRATVTPALTAAVRQTLSTPAQLPSLPSLAELPDPRQAGTTALSNVPVSPLPLMQVCPLPQPPAFAPAPGLSGVTKPPAAQAQPRTAPLPGPPRQPADRSTATGQARDSGGSNAAAMGTVSSSWRPDVVAAGRRLGTDLIARGRTVRYAGPPS